MKERLGAWGKFQGDKSHPLSDHMLDVGACFHACTQIGAIRRAMECSARRKLSEVDVMRLSALAFLHDVGKANSGFQAKRWSDKENKNTRKKWPALSGHTHEALQIFSDKKLLDELQVEELRTWGASVMNLWLASISHHGRPVEAPIQVRKEIWHQVIDDGAVTYDPKVELRAIGKALKLWFDVAYKEEEPLPDRPEFTHMFAGLVQFADWLGSDKRFFPYSEGDDDRSKWVWQRAQEAVQYIELDTAGWQRSLHCLPDFSEVFRDVEKNIAIKPHPIQSKMADDDLGPLLILESETGSGKTEAAIWRFVQLFRSGQVDSLYFALPTRVAATQLYNRLLQSVKNLWPNLERGHPLVVRALTGYACADGQNIQKSLPEFEVLWADQPEEKIAHKRWAAESSKRFLAAPLAVGTIDQALLSALQVRHAHMRHSLLSRSLLVVDEVHASDAYMTQLLRHLLKAHLKMGGHALLLSATLGSIAGGRYQQLISPETPLPTLAEAIARPYPALTDGVSTLAITSRGRNKQVHWQVNDWMDNSQKIANLVVEAAKHGAKVLVIRNTVPSAINTFKVIEQVACDQNLEKAIFNLEGIPCVHHSRFSREDRPKLDAAVELQIGKNRSKTLQACIVVGTQTLEQSLDIDADLLITDLCPMDVLLQRIGRLHRHERALLDRPENYREAQAIVLVPEGYSLDACLKKSRHGLGRFSRGGGIYMDLRILEATRRLISNVASHSIPQDSRELVEQATHPEALTALEKELGPDWIAHGHAVDGELHAKKGLAARHQLPFEQAFEDQAGNVLTFPEGEQKITTRLGGDDCLLTFEPPQPGPFGGWIKHLPIRHHMWPEQTSLDEPPVIQSLMPEGGFVFTLGDSTYRYSRFGLERIQQTTTGVTS